MQQAARLLDPKKRLRAYGELDADLARDAAPVAALTIANEATFVSERVVCLTLRPVLDLATVCLKGQQRRLRRLYADPDEAVGDCNAGRGISDLDRLDDGIRLRGDASERAIPRVRHPY